MAPHMYDSAAPSPTEPTGQNGNDIGDRNEPKYNDYIQWKCLPAGGPLNRWSQNLTRGHDFPGAQVCRDFTPFFFQFWSSFFSRFSFSATRPGARAKPRSKKLPARKLGRAAVKFGATSCSVSGGLGQLRCAMRGDQWGTWHQQ